MQSFFPVLNSKCSPLQHKRFLAEVNREPSRYLPVSPPPPRSFLNLSLLPRDFPSQANPPAVWVQPRCTEERWAWAGKQNRARGACLWPNTRSWAALRLPGLLEELECPKEGALELSPSVPGPRLHAWRHTGFLRVGGKLYCNPARVRSVGRRGWCGLGQWKGVPGKG